MANRVGKTGFCWTLSDVYCFIVPLRLAHSEPWATGTETRDEPTSVQEEQEHANAPECRQPILQQRQWTDYRDTVKVTAAQGQVLR